MENELTDNLAHRLPGQHVYEGMLMGDWNPRSLLEKVKVMEVFDDDVILSTYPKSGVTMLKEIVWLVLHDGDVTARDQFCSTKRVLFLEYKTPGGVADLDRAEQASRPRILKTHLPVHLLPVQARQKNIKQMSILRNPKDVLVSYYYFYKSAACLGKFTGTWDEFFEMAMAKRLHCGDVLDHVIGWWAVRHEPNVMLLFYEDIVRHPKEEIRKIADFLGKHLTGEDIEKIAEATSFKAMKANPMTNASLIPDEVDNTISPFIRKGIVGDWKNHFTINQNTRFDELIEKKLKGLDIKFTYE